jgi:hypothetical protein
VSALQRKAGLFVLFQGIKAIIKTMVQRMAFDAIRAKPGCGKFSLMVILMAIVTGSEVDRRGKAFYMTLFAIYFPVFPLQGVICDAVIKEIHGLERQKALLAMAFGAIVPEFPFVDVFMTGHAVVFAYIISIQENRLGIAPFRMARKTIYFVVASFQRKVG